MNTRQLRSLCSIVALLCTAVMPMFGVLAVVALCLASLRVLGRAPARQTQLSWVIAALPGPVALVSLLLAPLVWWERGMVLVGLLMQWLPIDAHVRWLVVVGVAALPLWSGRRGAAVLALIPALQLAATIGWPNMLDTVVVAVAGLAAGWCWWSGDTRRMWWCVALVLLGLNSSAAVTVLPWVLTLAMVEHALLGVYGWWAVAGALASAGYTLGAGLVVLPFVQQWKAVTLPERATLLVLLLWWMVPASSAVARLQTSLGLFGSAWSGDIVGFVDSQQRLVAQFPWAAVLLVGALGWAWWTEARHA